LSRKELVRDVKRAALARMESAARTEKDFAKVVKQWDHLDENRERREQNHEIGRPNEEMLHWDRHSANDEKGKMKTELDVVISRPLESMWWRQHMRGDFLDTIYDRVSDMWLMLEDGEIAALVNGLTKKQKEVLFLRAVRLCTAVQIACYYDRTDRAVRKLLAATLDSIQDKLAPLIRDRIETKSPKITFAQREFLKWYEKEKAAAIDSNDNE
jgi:DNA-directed RNA polymerase specialized sigma24 family protein